MRAIVIQISTLSIGICNIYLVPIETKLPIPKRGNKEWRLYTSLLAKSFSISRGTFSHPCVKNLKGKKVKRSDTTMQYAISLYRLSAKSKKPKNTGNILSTEATHKHVKAKYRAFLFSE
jgi:hypothetical protein